MHFTVAGFKNSFTDHFYFCAGLRVTLLIEYFTYEFSFFYILQIIRVYNFSDFKIYEE